MKQKTIDRQEHFAEENYAGLEDAANALLDKIEVLDEMWNKSIKRKDIKDTDDQDKWDETYDRMMIFGETMTMEMVVIGLKLSNTVGHALNAQSTKMIKKVLMFMDKYSLNDKLIHDGLMRIASKRNMSGNIIDMALVVAAHNDDIEFAKFIYDFATRNKDRKNIYDAPGVPYEVQNYGNMSRIDRIDKPQRIAFEALISNAPKVYNLITDGKGLKEDYIIQYIKGDYWSSRLTAKEVTKVIALEPKMFAAILEYMPENVPLEIQEMFLF